MNPLHEKLNAYAILMGAENPPNTPKEALINLLRDTSSELGNGLLALYAQTVGSASTQGATPDDWVRNFDFAAAAPLARIAWVYDESEQVEQRIDALLDAGDEDVRDALIDTLTRAEIAWAHPQIDAALDAETEATRQGAAWLLAHAAPAQLNAWLLDGEHIEDALDAARAVSLSDTDLPAADWSGLEQWREALSAAVRESKEVDIRADFEAALARVTGAQAVLDPCAWARLALSGDADSGWIKDPVVVADYLQTHGTGNWLDTLGLLEAAEDPAFEFGALLAIAAASGLDTPAPDEDAARELIGLIELPADAPETKWEPVAARLGLTTAIALTGADDAAPDDGLGLLLVQIAAHQRLTHHGYHAPGISGLPHSPSDPADVSPEASLALLSELEAQTAELDKLDPDTTVMILQNCLDLHRHMDHNPEQFEALAQDWADAFLASASPALRLASRGLFARIASKDAADERKILEKSPDLGAALALSRDASAEARVIATLAHHATRPGPIGLDCGRRLAELGTPDALQALAALRISADCLRAPFFAQCLEDAAQAHPTSQSAD